MSGKIIIISSPSGAGKTSITHALLALDEKLKLSISATTRAKRATEIDGQDYFFLSKEEFLERVKKEHFLEYAEVYGNLYGSLKDFVASEIAAGKDIVFDIDWQGARSLREHSEFELITVFILPPSIAALRERLTGRGLDSQEIIEQRMQRAKEEIEHYKEYDHIAINEDFQESISEIFAVIRGEKPCKSPELFREFVANLQKQ